MSKTPVLTPLQVTDHDVAGPIRPDDLAKLSAPLTGTLTSELDEARRYLGVATGELLIAALGRTIARAIGGGEVRVDVDGHDRPVTLACTPTREFDATAALSAVHRALNPGLHQVAADDSPVEISFSLLAAAPAHDVLPAGGHALQLRAYPGADTLQLDWWYDGRRLTEATVEDLAQQFPLALIEVTSEASPLSHHDSLAMA